MDKLLWITWGELGGQVDQVPDFLRQERFPGGVFSPGAGCWAIAG